MREYFVIGCEHSGTRLFSQNMCIHPDVEEKQVHHASIPSGGKNYTQNKCNIMRDKSRNVSFIFVMRDRTCMLKSQERDGSFNYLYEQHMNMPAHPKGWNQLYGKNVVDNWSGCFDILFDACVENNINYTIVSYEGYIQNRKQILYKMYSDLGLDPKIVDYTKMSPDTDYDVNKSWCYSGYMGHVEPKDGNAKYFT